MSRFTPMIAAWLAAAQAALAQPPTPPVGEERATIIAGIRESYPTMPDTLVEKMADRRRAVDEASPCELVDWLRAPGSGLADEPRTSLDALSICVLAVDDLDSAAVEARLGDESFRFDVEGGTVTMLARSGEDDVHVCCSLQIALDRLGGSDLWVARRRVAGLDAAMLSLTSELGRFDSFQTWRGPNAPPKPDEAELGKWAGQVIERELASTALGEIRKLSIYLPPEYTKDQVWPALFLADGGAVEFGGLVEKMIAVGEIKPIVIISAESGESGIVGDAPTQFNDLRAAEYLRGFPDSADRFERHMDFFAEELVDYAVTEFNVSTRREDRAVGGKSNGGVLALWAGVLHPDVFAAAIPMSPGYVKMKVDDLPPGQRAAFHLAAGLYEPSFIAAAKRTEAMLEAEGFAVTGRYYAGGHFHDLWAVALRDVLLEIFPQR